jgi:hypothetical protein
MSELISDRYRKQQERLHQNQEYGVASVGYAGIVAALIARFGITELLDYGSGKGRLMQALQDRLKSNLTVRCYDPAIPDFSAPPERMQMVACIDVLEHVELSHLDAVLDDLARCTGQVGFFTVHTGPAAKVLDDGRNAHLIQMPPEWWLPKLMQRFDVHLFERLEQGFYVVVGCKASGRPTLNAA